MRVGVVGLHNGHIRGMLRSAAAAPNVDLVGVVEDDPELIERLAGTVALPRYPLLDALLSEARPELIIEGVDHAEKAPLIEWAAAAGVHVLLDKPLCRSAEDWRRIQAAVQRSGIRLAMWLSARCHPPFVGLKARLEAGDLGEIVSIVATHPHRLGPARRPAWYWDPNRYAGTFHDLAVHGVDLIRWLTGAEFTGVHAVAACKRFANLPMVDHVQASFTLSDGTGAVVTADWLTPDAAASFGDTRFIVMGTRGSAHVRAYAADELLVVSDQSGVHHLTYDAKPEGPTVEAIVADLERGREPFATTEDVLAAARACLFAQESAAAGGAFLAVAGPSV